MAKLRATGADSRTLAVFETTYGTAPDGSGGGVYRQVSFARNGIGGEKPLGNDSLLGQGRDGQDPYFEAENVNGGISVPIDLRGIGFWLKGLLGDPATADNGDGTYDHVFTSGGDDLPSMTIEKGHPKLTTQRFELITGFICGSISFDLARTGPASASIEGIAQGSTIQTATKDSAPVAYALRRFFQNRASIKMAGGQLANVTAGSFNFTNNIEGVETIRDDGKIDGVDTGEARASGSVTVRLGSDTTISDAISAETPVSMEVGYSMPGAEGFKLTFVMPRVFLPKVKESIEGPGGIDQQYDWQAAFDSVAGHMMQVTLTNDVEEY
ncbi:hypothetical protein TH9_12205 [Thalassospira xiamenensis]|uniref:phage tail tube protein n=1 Tax=Thalassospira xiamenensis TaxID=220697 RepID=UPI000DED4927|nr:phage tail tube protein [Thalassospira xiamenensis]RCK32490.1 hypothetical protein TH9_12205 [Thalassospira xiamenensis]